MKQLSVIAVFLAVLLLVGCSASNTSSQSTSPATTAAASTAQSTQPETTTATTATPEKTVTAAVKKAGWVSAIGDSVMVGAIDALQQEIPNLGLLNAQGSRQPQAAIEILQQWQNSGYLGDAVVIDIGNNGPFTSEQFDVMMQVLVEVPKVLIVNLTVPPGVVDPIAVSNNTTLAEGVGRYSNTVLVDWQGASANHPEYFGGADNIHLSLEGAQAYAELIASQLGESKDSGAPPGPQERISWGEGGFFGECVGPPSWCAATATP